ncbi:MAG: hypothetical protein IKP28_05810 [Clostridia bacterium]|nr:hypothetical protein [Clostridia bacterium]
MFGRNKIKLNEKLDKVSDILKKSNLEEIAYILGNKKQILIRNFFAGISRGVGIGIGVTIITATLIAILKEIVTLNIPIIGEFISDIVDIVQQKQYY